ncbi:hypothetical protein [Streptomyces sp. NPDC088727]|uniref:hypothetical protein n=1 Tax=Streptomyces sp. NPDC088727 TaxID=3365875 RepID=UPI00380C73AD
MTEQNELRLLPWSSPEGKPCYLSTDDSDSHMSRLADHIEASQLDAASELVQEAIESLADDDARLEDVKRLAHQLIEALRDALRVAASRGRLLAPSEPNSV